MKPKRKENINMYKWLPVNGYLSEVKKTNAMLHDSTDVED